MKYKIATLNIRGMRADRSKASILKELLTLHRIDILFLQETHIIDINQSNSVFRGFNYKVFNSFGEPHSCGVSILVSLSINCEFIHLYHDRAGRIVYIDITLDGHPLRLINIYGPNNPKERRIFINRFEQLLSVNKPILLGGDFNFVESATLDKNNDNISLGGHREINSIKKDFDIIVPFRTRFPSKRAYTWSGRGVYCRLDRFYISKKLLDSVYGMDFINYPKSDHDLFALEFDNLNNHITIGPSYWKANVSLFNDLWGDFADLDFSSTYWWKAFKEQVKDLTIFYSKQRTGIFYKTLRNKQSSLHRLHKYSSTHVNSPNVNNYISQIKELEEEISSLLVNRAEGAKVRAKVDILDNAEKPSRYFYRRERSRQAKKLINKLVDSNSSYTSQEDIMNHVKEFYSNLYSECTIDNSLVDYFCKSVPHLGADDAISCEGDFTLEEFTRAIKSMTRGKTPGPDGLPSEFYEKFFHLFGAAFLTMINCNFRQGILPDSFANVYISLLCKDKSAAEDIRNWRPISLLNTDYKIISKALTFRLKSVIHNIVDIDQTCAVPGRSIIDNCHLIRNIIDYAGLKQIRTLILSLDLEKAFDKVSHGYLLSILKSFGFGPDFIQWISLIYNNSFTSVMVNGHISEPFSYNRGVRQGCCLSPLLYILAIEPLAIKIRRDNSIKGIRLPVTGEEAKVSQFADDITLILTTEYSVSKVMTLFDVFLYASGSNINVRKSKALNLGFWRNRPPDNIYGIPLRGRFKVCGILLDKRGFVDYDWSGLVDSIEKTTNLWKVRNLSFFEKSILINTVVLAKLWFITFSVVVPQSVVTRINSIIFSFLWGNRHECLSRKTMYCNKQNGGVGIIDIEKKLAALKSSHIKSLLYSNHSKWKTLAVYWFGFHLKHIEPIFGSNMIPHSDHKPRFYLLLLDVFKTITSHLPDFERRSYTTKQVYNILMSLEQYRHKVELHHSGIDFIKTWRVLNSGLSFPYTHELSFLMVHNVLPTQDILSKYGISRLVGCFFCKEKESISHLFMDVVSSLLLWNLFLTYSPVLPML